MKIRIKNNSVRFRLSRKEVEEFGKTGYLEGRTDFFPFPFLYSIKSTGNVSALSADYRDHTISLEVPHAWAKEWVNTDRTGFDTQMEILDGQYIYLLIEKDFKCLNEAIEDQADNYENPLKADT